MKRRCVIFGSAGIGDYERLRTYLKEEDFYLFCDGGLYHMEKMGLKADLIVGDFDSHPLPETGAETIVLPTAKDDTDTWFAVKEALRRGFDSFLFAGVIGGRFDHTLGNLSILLMLDSLGKEAMAVDDYSEMEIVSRKEAKIGPEWPYFSLLTVSGNASGVTIRNARFPLEDAVFTDEYSYGISNEPLPGRTASVRISNGRMLLVRVCRP